LTRAACTVAIYSCRIWSLANPKPKPAQRFYLSRLSLGRRLFSIARWRNATHV